MEELKRTTERTIESKLTLTNRKMLVLSGVQKVVSVAPTELVAELGGSLFVVNGANLEVAKLDVATGALEVSGMVDSMRFNKTLIKQSLLKRIFK